MKSLLEVIGKYSESNSIIPIIGLISLIVIFILHSVIKYKFVKYIVSVLAAIVGFIMFYIGYKNMLAPQGLDTIINAAKVLTFGIVGLLFSMILDLIDSLSNIFRLKKKQKVKDNEKAHSEVLSDEEEIEFLAQNNVNSEEINDDTILIKGKKRNPDETIIVKGKKKNSDETKVVK